jgi:KDO2-lipid IV(A) lauroyltransferase
MRQWLEYVAVRSVAMAIRPFPLSAVRRVGEIFGCCSIWPIEYIAGLPSQPAGRISQAIGETVPGHRESDVPAFRTPAARTAEVRVAAGRKQLALVEWEGEERVRLALAQGKGILFCTGHFRILGAAGTGARAEVRADGRHGAAARQPEAARSAREHSDVERQPVVYRRGAVRKALRLLAEGKGVGVLIDQHMTSPDAIYVDFFGRPAATTSTLAALAMRTGAPVIPLFAFPLPGGRYRMIYEHPVEPPPADTADAVREFTQRCTDVLEMHVRRHPELWLWMHRRWRDAPGPALDAAPGMFPAAKADLEPDT